MFEKLTDRLKDSYLRFKYDVRMAMFEASAETFFSEYYNVSIDRREYYCQRMFSDADRLSVLAVNLGIVRTVESLIRFKFDLVKKFEDRYYKKDEFF